MSRTPEEPVAHPHRSSKASNTFLAREGPRGSEFLHHLKTAKALDLTIPPSVVRRADAVIG